MMVTSNIYHTLTVGLAFCISIIVTLRNGKDCHYHYCCHPHYGRGGNRHNKANGLGEGGSPEASGSRASTLLHTAFIGTVTPSIHQLLFLFCLLPLPYPFYNFPDIVQLAMLSPQCVEDTEAQM